MNKKLTSSGSQTLNRAWEFAADVIRGQFTVPPMVAGDRLVCVTKSAIFALNLYTGEEVIGEEGFPYFLRPSFDPTPLLTHSRGILYFVDAGELVARQLSDGRVPTRWENGKQVPRWTPPRVSRAVSVRADDDVVVVVQADPSTRVTGFDALTGAQLWKREGVSQKSPGPVEATRDVITFVAGGHLIAINIRSGDTRFDFNPADDSLSAANPPRMGAVGDKSVVVVAGAATYGLNLYTGAQVWVHRGKKTNPNTQWLTPAISERYNRVVLANTDNEVFVLELTTGELKWSAEVRNVSQVRIVGDQVYAGGVGQNATLTVFKLNADKEEKSCVVDVDDVGRFGFLTGQGIIFTPGDANIRAYPFGDQTAALFDGRSSRITIDAANSQFDFRKNEFTIEAWVCTTSGGEIVSGFPTATDSEHHGFRLNVSDQGRVRFAIINKSASSSFAASSAMTNVADGSWHHVAVVRRGETVETYVDGISVEVFTDVRGPGDLKVSGNNALNIGAFVPGAKGRPQAYFNGLIRELRLWDIAVDAAKLQSRMQRVLVGTEPHLLGYWPLDEADITKVKNPRHVYVAKPQKMSSFVTELALDTSAFPYLLDQVKLQWPYAGHWSARGASEIATQPALERNGVISFGVGKALYGVNTSDGSRAWSRSTPNGSSAPVAGRGCFYALTGDKGFVSIDAVTGALTNVEGFSGLITARPDASTRLPAPATDGRYLAAASPAGQVWIGEDTKPRPGENATPWKWEAPSKISVDLWIADGKVYVIAEKTLFQLDPGTKQQKSAGIDAPIVVTHGDSIFCVTAAGTVARLSATDLKQKEALNLSGGAVITGLAAKSDLDLLVVATDKGELHGVTFATLSTRWTARLPATKPELKNSLHEPVIKGRSVFCTSSSGAVAAVDALTGAFRGLFFEPTSINSAPVVDAGSIYFGCDDAPADTNLLDGALHSVVFGQTHVLRLGLDHRGARETQPAYAAITRGDILELMGVDSCCIEAWVNTQEGGEILSIAPTKESAYGLRLWLDKNGQINFECVDSHDEAGAIWHRISSSASSIACDGKWHHIAVSRSGSETVDLYLDGVELASTTKTEPAAKPALSNGLKAFIGADATAAAPGNFFAGMIAEVRVWDTYLTATRISTRMHDKLLGNEPALLAYWNFDTLSIHDVARNDHEGKLETGGGSSGYWLADLNFTHPSYPYLETEGRILQEETPGDASTMYQLTVIARKADGTPLADHELTLWYVRHKGETGPDTIGISAGTAGAKLTAVKPDHGADNSFKVKTNANGKAVFSITTTQVGHGPSFDVRPAFLPENERYHLNVLIDHQKLQKPSPPKLEAQAKLTQDYHWETGDRVNEERDRATWRTVITARNSDGRPRAGERLQLWATEHVEVEVNGRRYPVNPNNYQSFVFDQNGELTVSLEADELHAPALSVWAGFMHRDERYTIPLDPEAHDKLSKIDADDLAEPRMTNWKPDYDPEKDAQAIVKQEYKQHAGKVATAIQHVMTVTQESPQGMRSNLLRAKRAGLRADRRNFADMRQAPPPPREDQVTTLRTLKHIERQVPLEPENFLQSLGQMTGFENSIGFEFSIADFELHPIKSEGQVQMRFMQPPQAAPKLLGNIFEDAWNAIESAAEAVWREAKRIAIYVADQVRLVVEYAEGIVDKVVATVKEAIDAVVHIIKMIGAFIADVIRFLMTLFDWGAILDAEKLLKKMAQKQLRETRRLVAGGKDSLSKLITGGVQSTTAKVDSSSALIAASSASTCRAQNPQAHAESHVNSVQGKYINNKVDERKDEIVYNATPAVKVREQTIDQGAGKVAADLVSALSSTLTDPLGISFAEIYESIKELVSGDIKAVAGRLLTSVLPDSDMLNKVFDALELALNAPIEIPFVSQLYKWITGQQLTLLDVFCWIVAIPAHVGYTIYTQIALKDARTFAKDFGPAVDPPKSGLLKFNKEQRLAIHWSYFSFNTIYTMLSGALKAEQIANPKGEWKKGAYRYWVPALVVCGLYSKSLLYTAGMKEEDWEELDLVWNSSLFGTTAALDIFLFVDTFFLGESKEGEGILAKERAWLKEKGKLAASVIGVGLLATRIEAWVNHRSPQSDFFQMRGVLNAISLMFSFDDTELFLDNPAGKKLAPYVIAGETIVKVAGGVMQMAAIQEQLNRD